MIKKSSITSQIAREIAETTFDDLPSAAVNVMKKAVMDNVGIAFLPGQRLDQALLRFAKATGGRPESTLIGDGTRVSCGVAADINAQLAADSMFDETGPGVHPLSPIGSVTK